MEMKDVFGTDAKKEIEGVWFPIAEGGHVKVARADNPEYSRVFRVKTVLKRQALAAKVLPDGEAEDLLNEVLSETILIDWKGITLDGVDVPYTSKVGKKYLAKYTLFRSFVVDCSEDIKVFKEDDDEATAGNSAAPLNGASSTERTKSSTKA